MPATWRPVIGYENHYEVSDEGEVRSLRRVRCLGRVLRQSLVNGYPAVCLSKGGKTKLRKVHQLVLEAFVGPKPQGYVTRHLDGSRTNNKLSNLAWGTLAENHADMRAHGRAKRPAGYSDPVEPGRTISYA